MCLDTNVYLRKLLTFTHLSKKKEYCLLAKQLQHKLPFKLCGPIAVPGRHFDFKE